jgi:hypothetical protein
MATSTLGSGTLVLAGTTSGTTTVTATAVAGTTTLTLPAATDTLVGKATTDTLTNKTLTTPSVSSPTISDGTANGVAYLNGSKVLTTGSALTWSGTLLSATTSVSGNSNVLSLINSNAAGGGQGVAVSGFSSNGSNSLGAIQFGGAAALGGNLDFYTANGSGTNTLNMRLDTSGSLLLGSSSTIGTGGKFQVTSSTDTSIFKCTSATTFAAIVSNVEDTSARLMAFQYGSGGSPTNVGTITTNGTGVTYGTSSDYRLKENIAPMTGALDKVAQLKPVTYKWKANGSDGQGFIAHELKEVVPDAVQGEKDAVDEDGNPVYQGIDTSYLVATLTAAIQEQQALITTLTARITALEGA